MASRTDFHRLIAPARIPSSALTKPVDIKLLGFAHRFAKGHAVRLTLAATDATSYNSKIPDQITVDVSGPGDVVVRVRASTHWAVPNPGCAAADPDGWTVLRHLPVGSTRVTQALGADPCPER